MEQLLFGIPIVFGILFYRGFCLGYTISTTVLVMGMQKGILLIIASILLQNLILIPSILAISVSGIKLYKSIIKNKERDNIKLEVIRHTLFSGLMIILLIIASLIEIFISTNILKLLIKYF